MEALVILLAEFLLLPVIAGLTLCFEFLFLLLELTLEFCLGLRRRKRQAKERPEEAATATQKSRILPVLRVVAGASLALVISTGLIINTFYFDDVLGWTLGKVRQQSDIEVSYAEVDGNLFTGRVEFANARISRTGHAKSNFDLQAQNLTLDASLLSVLSGRVRIEHLEVNHLSGDFERFAKSEQRPRRAFTIDRLVVTKAEFTVTERAGRSPLTFDLEIDNWQSEPLRSDFAAFDLLFRSNGHGRIAGEDFEIESKVIPGGRETKWRVQALPIEIPAAYMGGPFTWLTQGNLQVAVEDSWQLNETASILLDWQLQLSDFEAAVPAGTNPALALLAGPIVKLLNKHEGSLPIAFSLQIDEEQFRGEASPLTLDLWKRAAEASTRKLAELAGVDPAKIRELGRKSLEQFKGFLDRRRKGM